MAVTRRTLRLLDEIRARVDSTVDAATNSLVAAWFEAWQTVLGDWVDAVAEIQAASEDGKWPTRAQLLRMERVQRALDATYAGLERLSDLAGVTIVGTLDDVVAAAGGQLDVIASQLPDDLAAASLRASVARADTEQIAAIVQRTSELVLKSVSPLAGDTMEVIRTELIRGVALGSNPRTTARRMLRRIEQSHNVGLTRAMVIARTETLDAHRAASMAHEDANADLLEDWQWAATLDRRTCPSCLAQHGTRHPLDEPGPQDHPQGRCARLSRTKSWRDLGFDIDEPDDLLPDAQQWFATQPRDTQLQIMGPGRLQLLDDGQASFTDLSRRQSNPGWRDSYTVTPVRDLAG